jgi:hypothetical protein
MEHPDQRLLDDDLRSVAFRTGVLDGRWDRSDGGLPSADLPWPSVIFWIAAARRDNAPDRFFVRLDVAGYRSVPPTGRFWDPATKAMLEFAKYPKGKPDSRIAKVFRTDWGESGRAFYHPYDRVAAQCHPQWVGEQPHLVWTANRTIVDYLTVVHGLLNSGDYIGV